MAAGGTLTADQAAGADRLAPPGRRSGACRTAHADATHLASALGIGHLGVMIAYDIKLKAAAQAHGWQSSHPANHGAASVAGDR
jgi:hypothetical protein